MLRRSDICQELIIIKRRNRDKETDISTPSGSGIAMLAKGSACSGA